MRSQFQKLRNMTQLGNLMRQNASSPYLISFLPLICLDCGQSQKLQAVEVQNSQLKKIFTLPELVTVDFY